MKLLSDGSSTLETTISRIDIKEQSNKKLNVLIWWEEIALRISQKEIWNKLKW